MPRASRNFTGETRPMGLARPGAVLVVVAALAAPAAAASPALPTPPETPRGGVAERVTSARADGDQLIIRLACRGGGTLQARGAVAIGFACPNGTAAVTVPTSVLRREGAGRRSTAVRISVGGRVTSATVGLDARMGRRPHRASAAALPTPGVITHCYRRQPSYGGGGFQSVSINMNETLGRFSLLQTVYWQAYIYRSSTGTWASSPVDWYTIYRGGWSTGGYDVYNPLTGYTTHIIGGTTLDPWKPALWIENGYWTHKWIPPRTSTVAAVHVWNPGGAASMFYAGTNGTSTDPIWCSYN